MADFDSPPLFLDELTVDPELIHIFPSGLASRFHTLPIARAGGRLTMVIADPEDIEACLAIESALGRKPYFIRGDRDKIDALIQALYPNHTPQYILALGPETRLERLMRCARNIGMSLQIHEIRQQQINADNLMQFINDEDLAGCQLIVTELPERGLLQRIMHGRFEIPFLRRLPVSCLIAHGPWTSFDSLLFILHGNASDMLALEWIIKLASSRPIHVTAVVVLPHVPSMFDGLAKMRYSIPELLHRESLLGRNLRQLLQRLQYHQIKGDLLLRQGIPEWEVRRLLESERFDLVVTAYCPASRLQWLIQRDVLEPILGWLDRPLLIVK